MNIKTIDFIKTVSRKAVEDWKDRRIMLPSVVIAQAILESGFGTSELAVNANALFGIKKNGWTGKTYVKQATEQRPDGLYYTVENTEWRAYDSWDESIVDHNTYIATRKIGGELRYETIIGNTSYKTVCELLRICGYSTSLTYPQKLTDIIEKYDLTQYDKGGASMRINVHAGHNPDGKKACGAIGYIKESTEARKVKDEVVAMLRSLGHTVFDCTVDNGNSSADVLQKIVAKCNANKVDLDVSIHFNAGAKRAGDGKTTGTEVLVYSANSKARVFASETASAIAGIGYKNRGVKYRPDLYVLRKTNSPAMLIECCFVDDADDVAIYNYKTMAQAIVKGITGQTVTTKTEEPKKNDASFQVKIAVDSLNYRKGPGTSYDVVGSVKKGQVYTIVETNGSWGRLKSGAGWLNCSDKYVTRL